MEFFPETHYKSEGGKHPGGSRVYCYQFNGIYGIYI